MALPVLMLTGIVILAAMVRAYSVSRDPWHPMLFVGLFLLYIHVLRPLNLLYHGSLTEWLSPDRLDFVVWFRLVAVALFCMGCLYGLSRSPAIAPHRSSVILDRFTSERAYIGGILLGLVATGAFFYVLFLERSGLYATFSSPYAFHMASTGYLFETRWLVIPSILLLAMARQRAPLRFQDVLLAVFFSMPLIIPGLLGARRGPTFYALCGLAMSWFIVKGQRPSLRQSLFLIGFLGFLAICLVVYRKDIYLGSSFRFDPERIVEYLVKPERVDSGDDFIASGGAILTAERFGNYNWGSLWVAYFLIRPIPKQIWPTKYEDCGFGYLVQSPGQGMFGYTNFEWEQAAGFRPAFGAAHGFDAGFFLDFSWGGYVFCYLFGLFFAWVWRRERTKGGVWTVILPVTLCMSIYAPTQGAAAYLYFWILAVIPTALLWRFYIHPPTAAGPA